MQSEKNPFTTITYRSGDESLLDDIQEQWGTLNRHHRDAAVNFRTHYEKLTFEMRKKTYSRMSKMGSCELKLRLIRKLPEMSGTVFPGSNFPVMLKWIQNLCNLGCLQSSIESQSVTE